MRSQGRHIGLPLQEIYSPVKANWYKVALAQFYDDPLKEREWVEATKARLFFGYLDWVLADLEGMKPRDEEAAEEIRKLLGYLEVWRPAPEGVSHRQWRH